MKYVKAKGGCGGEAKENESEYLQLPLMSLCTDISDAIYAVNAECFER